MSGATAPTGMERGAFVPGGMGGGKETARQIIERARRATLRRQVTRDGTMRGVQAFRPSVTAPVRHVCCQWPLWGDERPRVPLFCGEPTRSGSSFCQAHHARVWVPAA